MGKKGGSKNKMAKMSEEERARYLQHRADIEEEARRRKQQLISLYMKNKLKREEAFSRLNLAKINQEWRSILRQIKCDELKNELIEVEKFFKEALEQKSRIIHRLLKDLDIAEEMYSTLVQAHLQNIDRLIAMQAQRMDFFKNQYNESKNEILRQCREDFQKFQVARNNSQKQLECVYYCFEEESENKFQQIDDEHLLKLDELRSGMAVKLEEITKTRETLLENLWKEYQQVLNDYFKHTESFYADYMELKENDNESTTVTRNLCYELERATDQLTDLKINLETITEEGEVKINYLKKYKIDMSARYLNLKQNLDDMLNFDNDKLKFMVVCAHNTIKFLEGSLKKGESLLQLAAVCRKLETEKEKVVPFGFEFRTLTDSVDDLKLPQKNLKNIPLSSLLNMEKFWLRVNNVQLDVTNLKEEKKHLEKENAKLKFELKQYLTNMAISTGSVGTFPNHTLRRPSSLCVDKVVPLDVKNHNQCKSATVNSKTKRYQFTCIEANLTNAVRSANLVKGLQRTAKIRTIVNL